MALATVEFAVPPLLLIRVDRRTCCAESDKPVMLLEVRDVLHWRRPNRMGGATREAVISSAVADLRAKRRTITLASQVNAAGGRSKDEGTVVRE